MAAMVASVTPVKDVFLGTSTFLLFYTELSVKSVVVSKAGHLIHLSMAHKLLLQAAAESAFHRLKWRASNCTWHCFKKEAMRTCTNCY